ncbi:hypothetical protein D1N53_23225, partial [Clostridioides difficile]
EAVLRKYIPKQVLLDSVSHYKVGDSLDLEKLTEKLVSLGYESIKIDYSKVSLERFEEIMQRVDDILGGGSAYAFDKLQRFGV